MKKAIWEFYLDKKSEYRWRAMDKNGNILFVSAEGYKNKQDAEQCAKRAGWGPKKDADSTTFIKSKPKKKNVVEVVKSWFSKKKPPSYGNSNGFF